MRLNKKRRKANNRKQHKEKGPDSGVIEKDNDFDEYEAPNYEEEYEYDTQSIEEGDEWDQETKID